MYERDLRQIRPIEAPASRRQYDAFVGAIGYETRSRFIAEHRNVRAARCIAIGYTERQVHAYSRNKRWFMDARFEVAEPDEHQYADVLSEFLSVQRPEPDKPMVVGIDISSLTRFRIASCVSVLRSIRSEDCAIDVEFLYAPARFSSPPKIFTPNREVGPLPGFAGWSPPGGHATVVVGVGYEHNKALGAVRYLDPDEIWAFVPTGHEKRYTRAIEAANEHLWYLVPAERRLPYHVFHPYSSFVALESLTCGSLREGSVTLLPFGPKLFALNSLLIACLHKEVAVWRVSSGHQSEPFDRLPNRKIVGLATTFEGVSHPASGKPTTALGGV